MNYQSSSLLFYSGKLFVGMVISITLALFGASAPVFYLFFIGLILPIAISLRLHILKQMGVVTIPEEASEWLIYVNGIPVRETRSSLKNPGFFSAVRAKTFFSIAFGVKLTFQLTAFIIMIPEMSKIPVFMIIPLIITIFWMLYAICHTIYWLYSTISSSWVIDTKISASGSEWHYGYLLYRGKVYPSLDRLLSLQ